MFINHIWQFSGHYLREKDEIVKEFLEKYQQRDDIAVPLPCPQGVVCYSWIVLFMMD